MKQLLKHLWHSLPYGLSIPSPLPYKLGDGKRPWISAHPDETGIAIAQRWPFPNYNYENRLWEFIQSLDLKPRSVAIDAGAGQGFYTLLLADKFEIVLAIEPNPLEEETLARNLNKYNVENIVILKQPLSDREEAVKLRWLQKHESRSSLASIYQADTLKYCNGFNERSTRLESTTLDRILKELDWTENIAFIKIDIEGSELKALRGAAQTIERNRPIVVCELANVATEPFEYHPTDIILRMKALDYEGFYLSPKTGTLAELDQKARHFGTEGIFLPNERM